MEEYIKAQIEAQLLRGTDPELSEVCGIEGGDPSEEWRGKALGVRNSAQKRKLNEYTDMLRADISGYMDSQMEEYERELKRLSQELFGWGWLIGSHCIQTNP